MTDDPNPADDLTTELRAEIKKLTGIEGRNEIILAGVITRAVRGELSGLAQDLLVGEIVSHLGDLAKNNGGGKGPDKQSVKKHWDTIRKAVEAKMKIEAAVKAKAEAERKAKEEAEKAKREKDELRAKLWEKCRVVAERKDLVDYIVDLTRRRGVIGEEQGIRISLLSATSRLCLQQALNMLRRGAAAAGKNYVLERVLSYLPPDSVIRITMASATAFFYYDVGNENSLKGKVIYVAEAAAIAEKNGVENPVTIILRCLISDGRIDHMVTMTAPHGVRETIRIRKNGPVAVVLTSARSNIEDELATRLAVSDADESDDQTDLVIDRAIDNASDNALTNAVLQAEVEAIVALQAWLELDAPYSVTIPFNDAIKAAVAERRLKEIEEFGGKRKRKLRIRRDINALISAIKASTISHKAQRTIDKDGAIIATLDDYKHGRDAVDEGLANLYKLEVPATTIAVVRAIEKMGASYESSVKVSSRHLRDGLGITGIGAAYERLKDAEDRGFIELVEKPGGYGKTTTREYKIVQTADEIEAELGRAPPTGVFPSAAEVEAAERKFGEGGDSLRNSGTVGTDAEDGTVGTADCSDCSTVLSTNTPLPDNFSSASEGSAEPKNEANPETGINPEKNIARGRSGEHIRPGLIVEKAKRLGVTLGLCADESDLMPFEGLPESVSAQIRAHKSEIVGHLRNETTIAQWLSEHPPRSPYQDDRCMHCGAGADGPDHIEIGGRGFVHVNCWDEWSKARRAYAEIALGLRE
jgi:hypothetical protein